MAIKFENIFSPSASVFYVTYLLLRALMFSFCLCMVLYIYLYFLKKLSVVCRYAYYDEYKKKEKKD